MVDGQTSDQPPGADYAGEARLLEALRAGDEAAFRQVVEQFYESMVRIAKIYVSDEATAEEVVQETWIAVLRGIERFEGRSSLKTWIFTILTNRAKTRAQRDGRYTAVSFDGDQDEPTVAPERFRPGSDPHWPNIWWDETRPANWENVPEERLLSKETMGCIMQAIETLPPNQREVIRLRDVEGLSAMDVCNMLSLSDSNQRVLLHRARSRIRQALEDYLAG
jgi:RNA polymerase sigma-70 factor, ECF subfamily